MPLSFPNDSPIGEFSLLGMITKYAEYNKTGKEEGAYEGTGLA